MIGTGDRLLKREKAIAGQIVNPPAIFASRLAAAAAYVLAP
jgi:hypothetical protein